MTTSTASSATITVRIVDLGGDRGPVFLCQDCVRPGERDAEPARVCVPITPGNGGICCYRCRRIMEEAVRAGADVRKARAQARRAASNEYGRRLQWLDHDREILRRGGGCCRHCAVTAVRTGLAGVRDHAPVLPGPAAPDPCQLGLL